MLMELLAPAKRDAVVKHVVIQAMAKTVARRECTIRPAHLPARLQKLPPPRQGGTDVVHGTLVSLEGGRHRRYRAGAPRDARRFQHLLLGGTELRHLLR